MDENDFNSIPLQLLSAKDLEDYKILKVHLASPTLKYQYKNGLDSFISGFDDIKQYCNQGDENDWKRSVACGVCWLDNSLGINTKRLEKLISKSKSTINQALKKLGYEATLKSKENLRDLFEKIPYIEGNYVEARMWSVRKLVENRALTPSVSLEIQNHQNIEVPKSNTPNKCNCEQIENDYDYFSKDDNSDPGYFDWL